MMWELSLQAWKLAGLPIPDYSREDMPVRMIHRSELDNGE